MTSFLIDFSTVQLYTSFAELNLWAQEPTNEYYNEANAIKEWYRSTWMAIKAYSGNSYGKYSRRTTNIY